MFDHSSLISSRLGRDASPAQLPLHSSEEIPLKFKLMKVEREQASLPNPEIIRLELSSSLKE
jgi:hypothetical protein